jgi:hypothetical protein
MTTQEEMRRRQAVAENAVERQRESPTVESLRSAFYAALYRSSVPIEEKVELGLSR